MLSEPVIVCAAVRNEDGMIIPSPRHFDKTARNLIDKVYKEFTDDELVKLKWEQGFIDQHGVFYTRIDAWNIAKKNRQIKRVVGGQQIDELNQNLYSENLY